MDPLTLVLPSKANGEAAAGIAPPGVVPDYDAEGPYHALATVVPSVYIAVMVLIVSVRFFTKLHVQRVFDYEDYILIPALISGIGYCAVCLNPYTSQGRHMWDMKPSDMNNWSYWVNMNFIIWHPAMIFSKWALLQQLQRIFRFAKFSPIWWAVQALLIFSSIGFLVTMHLTIFQCIPREAIWDKSQGSFVCINMSYIYTANAIINLVTNVWILCIPSWAAFKLNMSGKKKVLTASMFSLNCLSLFCSIMRVYTSVRISHPMDLTIKEVEITMWAGGEITWIIFATCFPTMPRFYKWCRGQDPSRPTQSQQRPAAPRPSGAPPRRVDGHWYALDDLTTANDTGHELKQDRFGHSVSVTTKQAQDSDKGGSVWKHSKKKAYKEPDPSGGIVMTKTVEVEGEEIASEKMDVNSQWFSARSE